MNIIQSTVALLVATTAACAATTPTTADGVATLTAAQISRTLANQTIQGQGWYMLIRDNGTLAGKEGSARDAGTWTTNADNQFCRTWRQWGGGQMSCFDVQVKGDTLKFARRSGPTATFYGKVLDGNPQGL